MSLLPTPPARSTALSTWGTAFARSGASPAGRSTRRTQGWSVAQPPGLQIRIGVEFKFQTFLNFRTFTVPWTFELTACLIPKMQQLSEKMLHFRKIHRHRRVFSFFYFRSSFPVFPTSLKLRALKKNPEKIWLKFNKHSAKFWQILQILFFKISKMFSNFQRKIWY